MAYKGYLIKVGNYEIDDGKYIKPKSYSPYINTQDLDSYVDANGNLHRNVLDHYRCKVEWETPPMLTNTQFAELMKNIRANFTVPKERKAKVTLYIPELDDYVTQDMYMPDPKPQMYGTYGGVIHYESIRLAFIGY